AAATAGTALFLVVVAVSVGVARRRLSYETWHVVHLLTYVAVALSFVYALALVVRFRVIAPLENVWRHRLRVIAVVPEADGVVSLVMQGRHVDELDAQAGQFFRWRFLT